MSGDHDNLADRVVALHGRRQAEADAKRAATGAERHDIADFADPVKAAGTIVTSRFCQAGLRTLHYWQGEFHRYTGAYYEILPAADVRALLYELGPPASAKPIKKRVVDDVHDALRAAANLSHRVVPTAPAWVDVQIEDPDPRAVIPLRNGLLDIERDALAPPTPRFFSPYCLPFDHCQDAPLTPVWLRFLDSIWPGDEESVECLQEWLGYLLTPDTRQQKGLLIVGPKRSGKGTIGRLIGQLVGDRNVVSPTLASLGDPFGLQPLIGKTVALMSDARLGGRADIAAIAESVLRLTGEDSISVARKFQDSYTARLLTRLVIFANEIPVFRDAASALPSRFVILRMERSFYGAEDHGLDAKLTAELPGILAWALEGLRRLRNRGRFHQPHAGLAELRLMQDLASPIGAFLRETCIAEPGGEVPVQKLYTAWREWCREHGRDQPGTEQTFGRDIAAATPGVRISRKRIDDQRVRYYVGLRLREPGDGDGADVEDEAQ